ncbi:MAG: ATP-binding protein [Chloroflexaceae bacterium]|nr:ATP-binding protein [Chloroflexaceae bacterium]
MPAVVTEAKPTYADIRWLDRYLRWLTWLSVGIGGIGVMVWLVKGTMSDLYGGLITVVLGLTFWCARLIALYGHPRPAIVLVSLMLFSVALVSTLFSGGLFLHAIFLPLMALILALPYFSPRAMRLLLLLVWLVTAGVALIARLVPPLLPMPTWIPGLLTGIGLIVLATLLILFWLHHRHLLGLLAEREATNRALEESRQGLEWQVAERTADLQREKELYRTLARHFPNGAVVLFDHNMRYLLAEGSELDDPTFNHGIQEGKTIWELHAPAYCAQIEPPRRQALAGTPVRYELNTGTRIYDVQVVPVRDAAGAVVAGMVVSQNITERKLAEARQRDFERQLQESQRRESLGVLAGGVAHDFNNLLTGMLGYASLALTELPPASPARESIVQVQRTAQRAAELTRQMLAYAGKGRFVIELVDLSTMVHEMVGLLRASIPRSVTLQCELAPNLPLLEGDVAQLRQVVMNLIVNAAEAIGDNPGTITIVTMLVRQPDTPDQNPEVAWLMLSVTDTGCGMDEQTQARIFDPFFTTKFTGRGLGLAAVQGIVRSHQGKLEVQSKLGAGTTFTLLLPVLKQQEVPAVATEPDSLVVATPVVPRGSLLVIDDEVEVRTVIARLLQRLGYMVLLAEGGAQALELLRSHGDTFAGVLLDLSMPGMSGVEVFRELRRMCPAVQVLLMSGYSDVNIAVALPEFPPEQILSKPFSVETLRAKLEQVLTKH